MQTSRDRFLIKEYLSASLYSDLFPTLLTCSPTLVSLLRYELIVIKDIVNTNDAFQELLASNRYGSIEKQGSGIRCSGFASFNTQMECVKQIVPKMVDEQRKVPMRRNSRFAAADPDKLQGLKANKVVRKPLISTQSIANNYRISWSPVRGRLEHHFRKMWWSIWKDVFLVGHFKVLGPRCKGSRGWGGSQDAGLFQSNIDLQPEPVDHSEGAGRRRCSRYGASRRTPLPRVPPASGRWSPWCSHSTTFSDQYNFFLFFNNVDYFDCNLYHFFKFDFYFILDLGIHNKFGCETMAYLCRMYFDGTALYRESERFSEVCMHSFLSLQIRQ